MTQVRSVQGWKPRLFRAIAGMREGIPDEPCITVNSPRKKSDFADAGLEKDLPILR